MLALFSEAAELVARGGVSRGTMNRKHRTFKDQIGMPASRLCGRVAGVTDPG